MISSAADPVQPAVRHGWPDMLAIAVLVLVGAAIWFPRMSLDRPVTHDGTVYIAGAQSLAAGDGYRYQGWIGQPKIGFYPPLHSVAMAPLFRGNPPLSEALPRVNWLAFAEATLAAVAMFWFGRNAGVPCGPMFGVMLCVVTSQAWIGTIDGLLSDFLFVAILYGWVLPLARMPASGRGAWGWLALGVGFAALCLTRSAALAWMPLFGAGLLFGTASWRGRLAGAVPVVLAWVGWALWARHATGYDVVLKAQMDEEIGGWSGMPAAMLRNAVECLTGLPLWGMTSAFLWRPPLGFVAGGPIVGSVLFGARLLLALSLFVLAGLGVRRALAGADVAARDWLVPPWVRPRRGSFEVLRVTGVAAYLATLAVLPSPAFGWSRYLLVVLPCFVAWTWAGLSAVLRTRIDGPWPQRLLLALLFANAAVNWEYERTFARSEGRDGAQSARAMRAVARWIRTNTPSTARIAGDFRIPNRHLAEELGRPLVIDYLEPASRWQPLAHAEQGFPRADYVVIGREDLAARGNSILFSVAFLRPTNLYCVLKVDPARESEFRRRHGIPDERPAGFGVQR